MIKSSSTSVGAALLLALLPALVTGCPKPLFSDNVVRTSDLVYGAGYVEDDTAELGYRLKDLYFDLIEPTDVPATNRPAVLMIHGGSFLTGTKTDENLVRAANGLATKGYVCFLIDYRLDGDKPPTEKSWQPDTEGTKDLNIPSLAAVRAAFVDAKTAMRHIRANSATYGIDPGRIAI
ncbi:MAG TPA: alpha/beta hydrolase [Candidatus Hydrogenedentes bacterium]|nr:alpha/beta hydrolase [Candidatus Hydrogenedentota bacterium]